MAIKSIDVKNVLIFKKEKNNAFHLDFADGINVVIGENGVGKTSILKMIYAAAQWSVPNANAAKTKQLLQFFSSNINSDENLKSYNAKEEYSYYRVTDGEHNFEYSLSHQGIFNFDGWFGLNIPSVFIPTTEMLSHSKGFLALNEKYKMPFDGTQIDIIVNASLPETREIPEGMTGILDKIGKEIGGEVVVEDDNFFIVKKDGSKIEFSLEAEGLRKLGLLWKLIRNGLLEKGTILLWDEPEANLNPELYPLVVDILLELQKKGVQIFLATHSYNFAKYLEIRRDKKEQVRFQNLYKEKKEIYCQSAFRMEELEPNYIMIADSKLLDEVYGQ